MSETVFNLFYYVENELVKSLGAVAHNLEGSDSEIISVLKSRVHDDVARAVKYPLPVEHIKMWLGIDAAQGLPTEVYSYLARTGKTLHLFEVMLKENQAPERPLFCITPVVDGKITIDLNMRLSTETPTEIFTSGVEGVVRQTDYLSAHSHKK